MNDGVAPSTAMPELRPLYRWRVLVPRPVPEELAEAARAQGLTMRSIQLLATRGLSTAHDARAFLGDATAGLHDPALLPDADRARRRIETAAATAERVLVFGDFDADGLTGLAILCEALRRLGCDAEPYVPSRLEEGHGLSLAAVERARMEGRTLIVTADCGTSSVDEVAAAKRAGIDVIITDHHRVPDAVPDAAALVNPHRPGSAYPDRGLSGSGVAFKVAQLILRDVSDGARHALELVDLAAIGTVADVAPIVGENRSLVRLGLERIRRSPRPGIAALLASAGVDRERVDVEALGYDVAPRLNASGRVGDALVAARLLLTRDAAEADALASEIEAANHTRRDLMRSALDEARVRADETPDAHVTIVVGDWPVGIIGLVAGRLADERNRPAVVLTRLVEPWRGSARSVEGYDLAAAFAGCSSLFDRFGGHAAAAGCSLAPDRFAEFRDHLLASAPSPLAGPRELVIDLALRPDAVDYALLRELDLMEPTGTGHPCPLVGIAGLVVTRVRSAGAGHTQLTLRKGREVVDGIAFARPDVADAVREGDRVDVVARLRSRAFGGFESLQLEIRDVAPAGHLAACARAASTASMPARAFEAEAA